MTADLKTQIHDFAQEFGSALPPIDLDDLLDPRVAAKHRPTQRRRGWVVALAAMTAVIVLMGGLALLLNVESDDQPPATEPEPSTTTPVTVPADLSGLEALGQGWISVPVQNVSGPGEGVVPFAAVNTRFGVVAVGQEVQHLVELDDGSMIAADPIIVSDPIIWVSTDGLTWIRNVAVGFDGGVIFDVTAGGPGLVAVGFSADDPAIWTSSDGVTWSRVPHDEELFPGCSEGNEDCGGLVEWVAAGDLGLVAAGAGEPGSLLWHSSDGLNWTRVDLDPEVFDPACLGLNDLTTFTGGAAVRGDTSEQCPDTTIWTTDDGRNWVRPVTIGMDGPVALAAKGSRVIAVAVGAPQDLTAFTSANLTDSSLWWSNGAVEWSPASVADVKSDHGQVAISDITATAFGFIATFHGETHSTMLVSANGQIWTEINTDLVFGRDRVRTITDGGPGLVAFGTDPSAPNSGIWVWSPPD